MHMKGVCDTLVDPVRLHLSMFVSSAQHSLQCTIALTCYNIQTDSFDEFMNNTMQELVSDSGDIKIRPVKQYIPGQDIPDKLFRVQFGQVYLSAPHVVEKVSLDSLRSRV
jgi:RNA polymerase beta subunit